jgi:hypothetical protein
MQVSRLHILASPISGLLVLASFASLYQFQPARMSI